jgi:hypothetical protein
MKTKLIIYTLAALILINGTEAQSTESHCESLIDSTYQRNWPKFLRPESENISAALPQLRQKSTAPVHLRFSRPNSNRIERPSIKEIT